MIDKRYDTVTGMDVNGKLKTSFSSYSQYSMIAEAMLCDLDDVNPKMKRMKAQVHLWIESTGRHMFLPFRTVK